MARHDDHEPESATALRLGIEIENGSPKVLTGPVPLAAIFRTRKERRRLKGEDQPLSVRATQPEPEGDAGYDIVLTDAYRVSEPSPPPPPAPQEELTAAPASPFAAPAEEAHIDETAEMPAQAVRPSLSSLIPANADPVWARDAILGLAEGYVESHRTPSEGAWFTRLFDQEYLRAHPPRGQLETERELDFIERQLCLADGARILDLGSGAGRHALPLAQRGYELVGLDLSLPMLKRALNHAQAENLSIQFVHGDMREMRFESAFDGAICMDTTFGYFSDLENLLVLRRIFDALKSGGRLVLDVVNRENAIAEIPLRNWWEGDGCLVQEDVEFNHGEGRLAIKRYVVFVDGKERVFDISLRLYSATELRRVLELVGFEVVTLSGSPHTSGAFFGVLSPRLIFTAQKP